jgi:hypothetical protein
MDPTLALVLAIAAAVAVVSTLLIRRRQRAEAPPAPGESPFAVSTEGMKICPKCGMGNLWTDRTCISCHAPLKG